MPISQSILRSLDFANNKSDFLDILSRSQCWSWQSWSHSIQSSTDKSQGSSEVLGACWMVSWVWNRLLENCSALEWPRKKRKAFHLEWGKAACLWPTEVQLELSTHLTIPNVHWHKRYRSWSCVDPEDNGIKVVLAYASQTLNHRAETLFQKSVSVLQSFGLSWTKALYCHYWSLCLEMGPLINRNHGSLDQMGSKVATVQLYRRIQKGKTK